MHQKMIARFTTGFTRRKYGQDEQPPLILNQFFAQVFR
jgi:hypothetical protein